MKAKSLNEIDENFKNLFEEETKKFQERISHFENRSKNSEYEKDYKKKLDSLLKKRKREVTNFLANNKDKLFESEEEKKKKQEEDKGPLDVKHLDLSLSKKEQFKKRLRISFFRLKLRIKNFYYHLMPSFLMFHFFKLKFNFRITFQDFFRKMGFRFKRLKKKLIAYFKRVGKFWKNVFLKVKEFAKKILSKVFKKKKKEGEEGEEGNEGAEEGAKEGAKEGEEEPGEENEGEKTEES